MLETGGLQVNQTPQPQERFRSDMVAVLWFWFPIGPAAIRTLLLFVSALSIFVLRVAQLHLGMTEEIPT